MTSLKINLTMFFSKNISYAQPKGFKKVQMRKSVTKDFCIDHK